MRNLIILTTIVLALLTLTGCGGGNQAQQAAANPAGKPTQQPQLNQQSVRPAPLRALGSTNSNVDFKKMSDDQIDQKYDQLKQSGPSQATNFGMQAWASRFPEAASKKPADNSWSMGVLERNRNLRSSQTRSSAKGDITAEEPPVLASAL
tara:strand:- start:858 stop:1307 length:450 start_codon:yes stop_codon:yes gene_type:complete